MKNFGEPSSQESEKGLREINEAIDFDDLYVILLEKATVTERYGGGYGIEKIITFIEDVKGEFNDALQNNKQKIIDEILANKSFSLHGIGTIRGLREKVIDLLKKPKELSNMKNLESSTHENEPLGLEKVKELIIDYLKEGIKIAEDFMRSNLRVTIENEEAVDRSSALIERDMVLIQLIPQLSRKEQLEPVFNFLKKQLAVMEKITENVSNYPDIEEIKKMIETNKNHSEHLKIVIEAIESL